MIKLSSKEAIEWIKQAIENPVGYKVLSALIKLEQAKQMIGFTN